MGRTVFFTSRTFGRAPRTIEMRCDFLHFEHRPDIVQRGAGGFVQRSIQPRVVTLANVHPDDRGALQGETWTDIAWDDDEGQRVEHGLHLAQPMGADLRCVFR